MNTSVVLLLSFVEPALCVVLLIALYRSREEKPYRNLAALTWLRLLADLFCLALLEACDRGIEKHLAYDLYFYVYWVSFALEALLSLYVILSIFRLAMAPLKGLQNLGMLVFRWASAISVALAIAIGSGTNQTGVKFFVAIVSQLQQISSVLTLCLLLFVCFAIRPLGLSFRSRIFGVSVGLGITATMNLVSAAWVSHSPHLYSVVSVVSGGAGLLTLMIWSAYFTFPEPKRRIIVLPTTSPFLRWNQISEVLGDEPGFVAVAGIPPEVFSPAELTIMARASAKIPAAPALEYSPSATPITLKSLTA